MPQGFSPLRVERSDPTLGESVESQGERRHPQIPFGATYHNTIIDLSAMRLLAYPHRMQAIPAVLSMELGGQRLSTSR